jgi:hypothetical protein
MEKFVGEEMGMALLIEDLVGFLSIFNELE